MSLKMEICTSHEGGFVEFGLALKLWRVIEGFSAEEDHNPIFGVERSLAALWTWNGRMVRWRERDY